MTEVKADREVGLAYMKAAEIEKRISEEARAEGKAEDVLTLLETKGSIKPEMEDAIYAQNPHFLSNLRRIL